MVLEVVVTTVLSSSFLMQGRIDLEHGLLDGVVDFYYQVCLLFLEDDEEDNRAFPLTPSILREFQGDGVNELGTPRNSTYRRRLALARETFSTLVRELAERGREWLAQEMLNDVEPLNDDDAVFRLWIFLGGPQGKIDDQT